MASVNVISSVRVIVVVTLIGCCMEITFADDHNPSGSSASGSNQNLVSNVDAVLSNPQHGETGVPAGHMKPLGSHRAPERNGVDVLDVVPAPLDFFEDYVKDGRPVLLRGAAKNMLAFKHWTDEYLRSTYGDVEVDVEEGKKENRSQGVWSMRLADYIDEYQKKDLYMVHSVPPEMAGDVGLLRCLQCEGFTNYLQDAVIWYSSGGTKSVLHYDLVDNVNCIIDGEKEFFMVDKRQKELVDIDNPNGAFCNVDVDKVDMNKYPGLGKVPWHNVTMHPGDCLFIPYKWFHHVHSQGRNLAVNIWFVHNMHFDRAGCQQQVQNLPEFVPLSQFEMASSTEQIRVEIVNIIDELGTDFIQESDMQFISQKLEISIGAAQALFGIMDVDNDKQISLEEIYNCDMKDILAKFFPEEEEEEEVEAERDEL